CWIRARRSPCDYGPITRRTITITTVARAGEGGSHGAERSDLELPGPREQGTGAERPPGRDGVDVQPDGRPGTVGGTYRVRELASPRCNRPPRRHHRGLPAGVLRCPQ